MSAGAIFLSNYTFFDTFFLTFNIPYFIMSNAHMALSSYMSKKYENRTLTSAFIDASVLFYLT